MQRLIPFLQENGTPDQLIELMTPLLEACKQISHKLKEGALAGVLGCAGQENVQGETQKKLDVVANDLLKEALLNSKLVRGIASEEEPLPVAGDKEGRYLVIFDPLDGSSNIDINVSVGTIFSILEAEGDEAGDDETTFLKPGVRQVASGYVLYGPSTLLTLTTGHGVDMFTLGHDGDFYLTRQQVRIPEKTQEFAINMSNQRFWEPCMQRYVADLLQGEEGARGKRYNMRWIASMVAEVHRILTRGGIFMYPWDTREPGKPGKLRLMYEGNPMSLLVEQAGGLSTNAHSRMLDIEPEKIHQRVSVVLGSRDEVEAAVRYHQESDQNS